MAKANVTQTILAVCAVAAVVMLALYFFGGTFVQQSVLQTGGIAAAPTTISTLAGLESSTITVNDYDRANDNPNTAIAGTWYVIENGEIKVNAAAVTSVDTYVGAPLEFYGTGTTYYGDYKSFSPQTATATVSLDGYTIAAEGSMTVTAYDNTGSTVLTADDDAENTADYSLTLGSGEDYNLFAKIQNKDDQSRFDLKAICTFYTSNGDISDFKLIDSDFTEVAIPLQLKNTAVSVNNDTDSNAFYSYYKHCYVYKARTSDTISLKGWDYTKNFQFLVDVTSGVNPAANGGDNFGAIFLDASYYLGSDGKIWYDFYTHDVNEYVDTVGMAETENSPQGLQTGFVIEGL